MIAPIDFVVPATAQKTSYLYADMRLPPAHDSLATVVLESGFIVDVGWDPPDDPHGRFLVRVLRGRFDEVHSAHLENLEQVVQAVESLARLYDRECIPASNSSAWVTRAQA